MAYFVINMIYLEILNRSAYTLRVYTHPSKFIFHQSVPLTKIPRGEWGDGRGDQLFYLVDKGLIHEVGPANAEVQYMDLLHDGVVEGVQEPRGVGYLRTYQVHRFHFKIQHIYMYGNPGR